MNEELIRKMIRMKLEIGTTVLAELPRPVQEKGKKVLELLQEELQSCLASKQEKQHEKQSSELTSVKID